MDVSLSHSRLFHKVCLGGLWSQITGKQRGYAPPAPAPLSPLEFQLLCSSDGRLGKKAISSNIRSSWRTQYKQRKFIGRFETYIRQTRVRCLCLDSDNLRYRETYLHVDNKPIVWTILTTKYHGYNFISYVSILGNFTYIEGGIRNLFKERASSAICLIVLWVQLKHKP